MNTNKKKTFFKIIFLNFFILNIISCSSNLITQKGSEEQEKIKGVNEKNISSEDLKKIDGVIDLQKNKKWKEANKAWQKLISQNIQSSSIYTNLAITYSKLNDLSNAQKFLKKSIETGPDNHYAWQQMGIVERRLGNFKQSEISYMTAIKIEPRDYISHINLGILYDLYLGKTEKAIIHFEKAQAINETAEEIVLPWLKEIKIRMRNET